MAIRDLLGDGDLISGVAVSASPCLTPWTRDFLLCSSLLGALRLPPPALLLKEWLFSPLRWMSMALFRVFLHLPLRARVRGRRSYHFAEEEETVQDNRK